MNKKNTATSGKLIKAVYTAAGQVCIFFVQVSSKYEMADGKTATCVASNSSGLYNKEMFL